MHLQRVFVIMKTILVLSISVILFFANNIFAQSANTFSKYKTGDIIFQSNTGNHAKAIEIATGSKFSHTGVIVIINNDYFVAEAVQPVSITPLDEFISRGVNHYFEVWRLKNSTNITTDTNNKLLLQQINKWKGKDYDLAFNWSDDELYCSELVYKLYSMCYSISIAKSKPLRDFNLQNPIVQQQLKIKYGNSIPYNEPMISPQQLYESALLQKVN